MGGPQGRAKIYARIRPLCSSNGGCSSVGRVPDCDSGCRGFESHQPPQLILINQATSKFWPFHFLKIEGPNKILEFILLRWPASWSAGRGADALLAGSRAQFSGRSPPTDNSMTGTSFSASANSRATCLGVEPRPSEGAGAYRLVALASFKAMKPDTGWPRSISSRRHSPHRRGASASGRRCPAR